MVNPFSLHINVKKGKKYQVFHTEALLEFCDKTQSGRGGAGDQTHWSDTGTLREVNKT